MNSDEVVCSCLGVTAGMIKDAIDGGARTYEEVKDATGAGSVCGVCEGDVQNVIDEILGTYTS